MDASALHEQSDLVNNGARVVAIARLYEIEGENIGVPAGFKSYWQWRVELSNSEHTTLLIVIFAKWLQVISYLSCLWWFQEKAV